MMTTRLSGFCSLILSLFALYQHGATTTTMAFSFQSSPTRNIVKNNMVLFATAEDAAAASTGKTLTLYGHQGSRSPLVNWGAYELGLVDIQMGDLSKNPHPFGKIPCLTDNVDEKDNDDVVIFESGAILEYLQDNYGNSSNKKKPLTRSQRAAVTSWIVWANASLDPVCFIETPQGKVYDTGFKYGHPALDRLNDYLKDQKYLLGGDDESFSLADVAVASYLLYVPQFFPDVTFKAWPYLARYMKDCATREAYGEAFGSNVQGFLLEYLDTFVPKEAGKR
jgi:glutathione S-transferase/alpha,alpha-trehalase